LQKGQTAMPGAKPTLHFGQTSELKSAIKILLLSIIERYDNLL